MAEKYISVEALFEKTTRRNHIWDGVTNAEGKGLTEIVNDIPPADVVSRSDVIQALYNALYIKCGRWIDSKGIEQMCTELWALIEGLLPSCRCGADMRPEPEKERSDE